MKARGMVDRSTGKLKDDQKPKDDDLINDELDIKDNLSNGQGNETKIRLSHLNKANLIKFTKKKKLYEKSFEELEPDAIIPVILEKAKTKIVEAGLKTAEEAASLSEDELFVLLDTIGK
jgi:hypothetical protein